MFRGILLGVVESELFAIHHTVTRCPCEGLVGLLFKGTLLDDCGMIIMELSETVLYLSHNERS